MKLKVRTRVPTLLVLVVWQQCSCCFHAVGLYSLSTWYEDSILTKLLFFFWNPVKDTLWSTCLDNSYKMSYKGEGYRTQDFVVCVWLWGTLSVSLSLSHSIRSCSSVFWTSGASAVGVVFLVFSLKTLYHTLGERNQDHDDVNIKKKLLHIAVATP